MPWCVIQTKPGDWHRAQDNLRRQSFNVLAPLLREHRAPPPRRHGKVAVTPTQKLTPMFPGYVFMELDPRSRDWMPAASTIGVHRILGNTPDRPSLLPTAFVEHLQASGPIFDVFVDALAFKRGDIVEVTSGPFQGRTGRCEWTGKDRVAVLLDLLGRSVCVYSGPEVLRVVKNALLAPQLGPT